MCVSLLYVGYTYLLMIKPLCVSGFWRKLVLVCFVNIWQPDLLQYYIYIYILLHGYVCFYVQYNDSDWLCRETFRPTVLYYFEYYLLVWCTLFELGVGFEINRHIGLYNPHKLTEFVRLWQVEHVVFRCYYIGLFGFVFSLFIEVNFSAWLVLMAVHVTYVSSARFI